MNATFVPARCLRNWVGQVPTPFYIYSERGLREQAERLFSAFSQFPGFSVRFPVRMNPNPAVLSVLKKAGCGVECGSTAELLLAKSCGFSGQSVLYAPIIPDEEGQALAAELDAAWLLHGVQLLPPVPPKKLYLCCNPGGFLRVSGKRVLNFDRCKFGMSEEELGEVAARFRHYGQTELGLAFRGGDNEPEADYAPAALRLLLETAEAISEKAGVVIRAFDLSGSPVPDGSDAQTLAEQLLPLLPSDGSHQLSLVPGRFLAAQAGILLTRVCAVVPRKRTAIYADCSFSQFPRPLFFASHPVSVLGKRAEHGRVIADVFGCLPDLRDRLAERLLLPPVKPGDCLIFHDTGADGCAMSSRYGGMEPCAEYLFCEDGSFRCISEEK